MSNQVIFYTQLGSILAFISSLFILYRLLVQQKEATIQLLTEKNQWLQDQVTALKENRPDVLLENLERRLNLSSEELMRLNEDTVKNAASIHEKELDIENLLDQIEELKSRIDECPYCEAELTMMGNDDVEQKIYSCGYSIGYRDHPCPHDPNFPKLEEYKLTTKFISDREIWLCFPEPQTEMAEKLKLTATKGKTEQEVIEAIEREYTFLARWVPKSN